MVNVDFKATRTYFKTLLYFFELKCRSRPHLSLSLTCVVYGFGNNVFVYSFFL